MSEINYRQLSSFLKQNQSINIFLIYGDELLCKNSLNTIFDLFVSKEERNTAIQRFDGVEANIAEAIREANTFPLFTRKKIVVLSDTDVFQPKSDAGKKVEKTNETVDINVSKSQDSLSLLLETAKEGIPKTNCFIITSSTVDKRKSFYKKLKTDALIIDCSVPEGSRMADKKEQDIILQERIDAVLKYSGKILDADAYRDLLSMTGFDLRIIENNLEKLVLFTEKRKTITSEDVKAVLKRTKKDPIYEFTNALAERNLVKALFYKKSLLTEGELMHPLQLIMSVKNQLRKFINIKGFLSLDGKGVWRHGCRYDEFQSKVLPVIKQYDKKLLEKLDRWEAAIAGEDDTSKKVSTEAQIISGSKSPYPVYLMMQRAENFTKENLMSLLELAEEASIELKTSGYSPDILLEKVIFAFCSK